MKIVANELRIENILLLDGIKLVKVIWFRLDKACVIELGKDYPSAIVDIDRLNGVALTEEILLKCGFNGFDTTILTHDNIDSIYLRKPFIQSNYYLVKSNGGNKLTSIQYIHQLQNLYFAIVGKELIYNG